MYPVLKNVEYLNGTKVVKMTIIKTVQNCPMFSNVQLLHKCQNRIFIKCYRCHQKGGGGVVNKGVEVVKMLETDNYQP